MSALRAAPETLPMPVRAFENCLCRAISRMRSRTSAPLTGLAVVAMRMMECVRSMRYRKSPHVQRGHQSATVLPIAWNIT